MGKKLDGPKKYSRGILFVIPTTCRRGWARVSKLYENFKMRDAIPVRVKLQITLSYLAIGNSYRDLQRILRVSRSAISGFIPEVCHAIYEQLKEFIKVPSTAEEFKKIENGFGDKWNFPGCYGAIDGKHIVIQAPADCGSDFYNYKGTNSIILLAVVDDDYCFWYINIGSNGRQSDGGVFQRSTLFQALESNLLPDGGFLVGDDAFPLKPYLMKPYSKITFEKKHKVFNYRLSRARRMVENGFGILVSRFRIFQKPIPCSLPTIDKIVKTCCVLHNWLRKFSGNRYIRNESLDDEDTDNGNVREGSWRTEIINNLKVSMPRTGSNHSSTYARQTRDEMCEYCMTVGAVSWQDRMIY